MNRVVTVLPMLLALSVLSACGLAAPPSVPPSPSALQEETRTPIFFPTETRAAVSTPAPVVVRIASGGKEVYLDSTLLLDVDQESPACSEVDKIIYSPTSDHFLVLLACFEGDNDAFLFPADGSGKRRITDTWDLVNYANIAWSPDGASIAYARINSCCADEIPESAPPQGLVRYDLANGQKTWLAGWTLTTMEWSPDGRWIAFLSGGRNREGVLYLVESDGSALWRLDSATPDTACARLNWSWEPSNWEDPKMSLWLSCEEQDGTGRLSYLVNTASDAAAPTDEAVQVSQSPSLSDTLLQYRVTGVRTDDVLNIRSGPGVTHPVIGEIRPDGTGVQITGDATELDTELWVPITYQGITGWVNSRYLELQPTH